MEQISFEVNDFAMNAEPRCPCVLLLDVSGSMGGKPIDALNEGIAQFKDELAADSLAMKRIDVAIVTFGPVETVVPFTAAEAFYPPMLHAQADTPMGSAIRTAIDMVTQRKAEYRENGIAHYRPWIFLITDGGPTDEWRSAAAAVHAGEERKEFAFFAVAVEGANMDTLNQICVRKPLKLNGLRFRDLFVWLSASMKSVSRSTPDPDAQFRLEAPTGWASL